MDSHEDGDWAAIDALIHRIYDCVLHPDRWTAMLDSLVAQLCPEGWPMAFLMWEDNQPPTARFIAEAGLSPGMTAVYSKLYAAENPWSRSSNHLGGGDIIDTRDLLTADQFAASAFSRDYLGPMGIDRAVGVMLDRHGSERLALILMGPGDRPLLRLMRGLRMLAPHLQRAIRISHRLATVTNAGHAASAASDATDYAVLSCDRAGNILSANSAAQEAVAAGIIARISGRLAFGDRDAQRSLDRLLDDAPAGDLAFNARDRDGNALPVLALRVPERPAPWVGGSFQGAALIVTIGRAPDEDSEPIRDDRLAQWFGLTPTEARLAAALAAGMTLADYAIQAGVTINAARFALKGVFRKTGVSSQAQLVARIAALPGSTYRRRHGERQIASVHVT